ncbi:MAG: phosphohistidine phosphatase SixA [Pirellulales bacterium]
MKLYIVRHGLAGEHGDPRYPDDRLRPLTDEGRKRFADTMRRLADMGFAPQVVATSPLVRCRQTAEIVVESVRGKPKLVELSALQPGANLDSLIQWTNDLGKEEVAWVGHAPDVSDLAAALVSDRGDAAVRFAKGAVACVAFDGEVARGAGELQWLVTAKVLGSDSRSPRYA